MTNPYSSQLDPEERLSRFILTKRHFSRMHQKVKVQAFKPHDPSSEHPERQHSVYRTDDCSEEEIWSLGDEYVTRLRPDHKPILGRGDIKCKEVLEQDLLVVSAPVPHPRHANIVNWPEDESLREAKALELSRKAQLHLRQETSPGI